MFNNSLNYLCTKCNKSFKHRSRYEDHLNKKIPCDKVKEELKCELCNISFSRPNHKIIHENTSKHIKNLNIYNNKRNTININFNNMVDKLKKKLNISCLNQFLNTDVASIDYTKLMNILTNSDIIYQIKTLNEEYDEMDHTTDDYYVKIFISCLIDIFKELNFDLNNPQNHNCKILAFFNTTDNKTYDNKYLILDKDFENLFYWNELNYIDFINALLKLMNLVKEHFNIHNLNYIMNYLNKYLKDSNLLKNKIKKEVEMKVKMLSNLYKSPTNNFNFDNEIQKYIDSETKLITGEQPRVKFLD